MAAALAGAALTAALFGAAPAPMAQDDPPGHTPSEPSGEPGRQTPGSEPAPPEPQAPAPAADPPREDGDPLADAPQTAGQQTQEESGVDDAGVAYTGKPARVVKIDVPRAPAIPALQPQATRERAADGVPTAANPSFTESLPGPAPLGVPNFFIEKFRIPPFLLPIYQAAGIEYGIRWEILAAINEIETDYGRNLNVSSAGALGWMQFMPATWRQYGVDANRDRRKDPYNPVDAIFAAARYLKAAGAEQDIRKAVFAYNHADWYVDSVLLRARLIGGLPADLVGSLTGLTQGHFPVHAKARYADDISERDTRRKIAKGDNAAIPIEANTSRRGIHIYAQPGSPVIAVQDGTITRIGNTKRLGRYIQLRDVYGNTYTYAHLKKIARFHPLPRRGAKEQPAITGVPLDAPAGKERVFANPGRPRAFKAGGEDQILLTKAGTTVPGNVFMRLRSRDVVQRPLRGNSRVLAGTILGRVGAGTKRHVAPHVLFEIRPAGRGAPRVDPKPILDGWKLLESTAIYRATGRQALLGDSPTIGQILLMGKEALQRRILSNTRIEIYGCGREDIRTGIVDRRVLATLEFLAASGFRPGVTSLRCGHGYYTKSGNVSHHSSGSAVDIAKLNGLPVLGHQGEGSITELAVRRLLTLQGTMKPAQIISLMSFEGTDNTLALSDHADHIHVGFQPLRDDRSGRRLGAVLKPGQWVDLMKRLGTIENPEVLTSPSRFAIEVPARRPRPGR